MIKCFALTVILITSTVAAFGQNPNARISQTEKSKNEVLTVAKLLATAIYVNYDAKVAETYLANEYTEPSAFYIEIRFLGARALKSARNKSDVIANLKPPVNVANPGKSFIEV
jgi:hypothetical protein